MLFDGVDKQMFITNRLAMPVDALSDSAKSKSISGETIQFYYYDAATGWTIDAGEDAGTVVMAVLAQGGVQDSMGAMIGNDLDTSFEFTTGTVLVSASIQKCDNEVIESPGVPTLNALANKITNSFASGEWCLDHRNGVIYGKKATAGVSDTGAYTVKTQSSTTTEESISNIAGAEKTITTAGTDEALVAVSTPCKSLRIVALDINTGYVYVGIDGFCSATEYFARLSAGQGVDIGFSDAILVHLDAAVSSEKVNYFIFNE